MAGFTRNPDRGNGLTGSLRTAAVEYQFHIDTPNVGERIRAWNDNKRVIVMQLDGDELDAALWGLEHYKKGKQ